MAARKKSGGRKYGKSASKRVASAMRRRKKGTLKSGRSGRKVKSREQAIAARPLGGDDAPALEREVVHPWRVDVGVDEDADVCLAG